jgi:biopolymer transport protein TolQ
MEQVNLWSYFVAAGPVVKVVLLLLISTSLLSWTIIIHREYYLKMLRSKVAQFETQFWSGINMTKLYASIEEAHIQEGISAIFYAGYKEFIRLNRPSSPKIDEMTAAVQRAMQIVQQRDIQRIEKHLPMLASIGSVSPYIGLFGTVWGMMTALHALGQVKQASIAMVAPGISEALIATAMGLFAAIPAVLAYNRYTTEANMLNHRYDLFREEFVTLLQQQMGKL